MILFRIARMRALTPTATIGPGKTTAMSSMW